MLCKICSIPLTGRQTQFCSIRCRNTENGRRKGGWNKDRRAIVCEVCNSIFEVSPHRIVDAKHCSRRCHNKAASSGRGGPKSAMWRGGKSPIFYIPESIKIHGHDCQSCGTSENVDTHHRDGNRENNPLDGSNWRRLCRRCHQTEDGRMFRRDDRGRYVKNLTK